VAFDLSMTGETAIRQANAGSKSPSLNAFEMKHG